MEMKAEPTKEHVWLQKLLGEWTVEGECPGEPGQPPMKTRGTERVRQLGDVWVVADGEGEMPGGGTGYSQMTLGFDPKAGRFVGSWVGSMMTHFWKYEGKLDASGKVLTLEAEGPNFANEGKTTTTFNDVIEWKSDDHRTLTGRMLVDGKWVDLMTAHYRRKK
ncbi:MAG: DUF1579 domain-containing protein [Alphaproteobacteria bacterium]